MTTPLAICCKNVQKTYRTASAAVQALRGVDLELEAGKLLMIVGPSGSGKTTLISIIAGILNPDIGECKIFGTEMAHLTDREKTQFRGKHIGFVFQAFNLIPMLTARENVAVPLLLNGEPMASSLKKAEEILVSFDLKDKLDKYPAELSGGQQQRVAIARSAVHSPQLIVCDEPTSALDHETGVKVLQLLKEQVLKENRALVVVTHDQRIFPFADRIVKLDDGKIINNTINHSLPSG